MSVCTHAQVHMQLKHVWTHTGTHVSETSVQPEPLHRKKLKKQNIKFRVKISKRYWNVYNCTLSKYSPHQKYWNSKVPVQLSLRLKNLHEINEFQLSFPGIYI